MTARDAFMSSILKSSTMLFAVSVMSNVCSPKALSAEVSLPAFYQRVTKIERQGQLGRVVAAEQIESQVKGSKAWRIAYHTSDGLGNPTISTSLVIAPIARMSANGRPIIAWAHGTTGTAQNCGPSQVLDPAQDLNEYFLVGGTSWTDFGIPALEQFIKDDYVIVAPDYQGLGGGGAHQYSVATTQAHDVIDSIRAAGSMGLSGRNRKAIIYGWSQGGGAAISAASMPDYLQKKNTAFDGVELIGAVALAPQDLGVMAPQENINEDQAIKYLENISHTFTNDVFNFTHFAMYIKGLTSAYPELKMSDIFTADSVNTIQEILSKKCMHPAADTIKFVYGDSFKQLINKRPINAQNWVSAMLHTSVFPTKPVAPVIIYFGTKDTAVPPVMGQLYREQMCKLGGNVTRIQLPGEQSHYTTPPASKEMFVNWMKERFAGKPIKNGCEEN